MTLLLAHLPDKITLQGLQYLLSGYDVALSQNSYL